MARVVAMPDTLVGTDSHTTMINGLGVLGWGVGGIEAEAVMLGQPLYMVTPQVVGMRLRGELREGVTATDLVLTVTAGAPEEGGRREVRRVLRPRPRRHDPRRSRHHRQHGAGVRGHLRLLPRGRRDARLPAAHRADAPTRWTSSNVIRRSRASSEPRRHPNPSSPTPWRSTSSSVEPSLAGPKRPHDRVALSAMKSSFRQSLLGPVKERGFGLAEADLRRRALLSLGGDNCGARPRRRRHRRHHELHQHLQPVGPSRGGSAGQEGRGPGARGASARQDEPCTGFPSGHRVPLDERPAPRSRGPGLPRGGLRLHHLHRQQRPASRGGLGRDSEGKLVASAVLSGNRNFEGRINPDVKANYLASPPLVVAYALAGTTDIDLSSEPLGRDREGRAVLLREIWPSQAEVAEALETVTGELFSRVYADAFDGGEAWSRIPVAEGDLFSFREDSTYIQEPPFFRELGVKRAVVGDIEAARVLAVLGDSVTTDHISPAGDIAEASPAGRFLRDRGVSKADFNSYGSRRGNDRIMVRGTFANIRLKNLMVPGVEGGVTVHVPSGERLDIFDAAERYAAEGTPLVILAGKEYGSGSSRDWAAKGTMLLGVRVVIAESYERIHRSNLVGMGILPLQFEVGQSVESLGLTGFERFAIAGLSGNVSPRQKLEIRVERVDGSRVAFNAVARLDSPVEIEYWRNGGILQTVLRKMLEG